MDGDMNTFLNRWIMEHTGLHITPDKQPQVDAALRELAAARSIPIERCIHLLINGNLSRDEFIDLITTPESYFLRHKQIMTHVVDRIIPQLLQKGRKVRVLCLPCARGEEPHTLAMMLYDRGINPGLVEIIGADISQKRIEEARIGTYSQYSLRTVPADFRQRHFVPAANDTFQINQDIMGSVRFMQINLLQDALLKVSSGVDIVFCHNLFIYFDRPTIRRALSIIWELLAPQGWFFVDTTEIPHVSETFQRVAVGAGFGFRKGKVTPKAHSIPIPTKKYSPLPTPRPKPPMPFKKVARPAKRVISPRKITSIPAPIQSGSDLYRQAETAYRAKELDQARSLFEKLLTEEQWRCKARIGLTMICSDRGEQMEAIEHADAVLNAPTKEKERLSGTELGEIHAIVAVTLFNKGLHDQAKNYFEKLQKLAPDHQALKLFKR